MPDPGRKVERRTNRDDYTVHDGSDDPSPSLRELCLDHPAGQFYEMFPWARKFHRGYVPPTASVAACSIFCGDGAIIIRAGINAAENVLPYALTTVIDTYSHQLLL